MKNNNRNETSWRYGNIGNRMWYKNGPLMLTTNHNAIIRLNSTITNKISRRDGWMKAEGKVNDLQEKIVIAKSNENMKQVYRLQWILVQSFVAKAMAIRKVVTNKGGKTAGVDGVIWDNPERYWIAIEELSSIIKQPKCYIAQPVRRVMIPKVGSKEKRPLGIPTMIDRAVQAVYHLGVDPAVEAMTDKNSFGFRKSRSTHDAVTAIRMILDKANHPHWIVEAEITKCFDRINHEFLIKHTPIRHKNVLEQWLKAGIMEELNFMESNEGTPQGGIMSPTLCNVALKGIEKVIKDANPLINGISQKVNIIRYADEMIITARTQEWAIKNKQRLAEFLAGRDLELNERKTEITHIKQGFDFLGFNFKRLLADLRLYQETEQDTVLIIKLSKKGIDKLVEKIKKCITKHRLLGRIISDLNPVLSGWAEHKRISYHTQATFIRLDHYIFRKMLKWAKAHKGALGISIRRYVIQTPSRWWNWGTSQKQKIINLAEIPIIKVTPLKLDRNPYVLENKDYFNKTREKLISTKFKATIYKIYKHLCPICGESLHNGESEELHHIIPRKDGGKYSIDNILPLHEICHRQRTHGNKSLKRFKIALPESILSSNKKKTRSSKTTNENRTRTEIDRYKEK